MSMTGVPSNASMGPISTRVPSSHTRSEDAGRAGSVVPVSGCKVAIVRVATACARLPRRCLIILARMDATLAILSWSDIANIVTAIAVVLGIPFALVQLHYANRSRRDVAAVDIVRTVQTQEVRRAVERVLSLPVHVAPDVIGNDASMRDAALAVDSACEMWGCMVYEGVVDHRMLDSMVGGWIRGTWRRLERWIEAERLEKQNPNIAE